MVRIESRCKKYIEYFTAEGLINGESEVGQVFVVNIENGIEFDENERLTETVTRFTPHELAKLTSDTIKQHIKTKRDLGIKTIIDEMTGYAALVWKNDKTYRLLMMTDGTQMIVSDPAFISSTIMAYRGLGILGQSDSFSEGIKHTCLEDKWALLQRKITNKLRGVFVDECVFIEEVASAVGKSGRGLRVKNVKKARVGF